MAQLVKRLTMAQVMILRFVSSGPVSVSVLTAQNLEPASGSVSLLLSAPPMFMFCLSITNKHLKKTKKKKRAEIFTIISAFNFFNDFKYTIYKHL